MKKTSKMPAVETSQTIVNQGSVPLAQVVDVGVPPAPKGEQTARGFGAMLRPQKFVVR
jgi:hypothetical protein